MNYVMEKNLKEIIISILGNNIDVYKRKNNLCNEYLYVVDDIIQFITNKIYNDIESYVIDDVDDIIEKINNIYNTKISEIEYNEEDDDYNENLNDIKNELLDYKDDFMYKLKENLTKILNNIEIEEFVYERMKEIFENEDEIVEFLYICKPFRYMGTNIGYGNIYDLYISIFVEYTLDIIKYDINKIVISICDYIDYYIENNIEL